MGRAQDLHLRTAEEINDKSAARQGEWRIDDCNETAETYLEPLASIHGIGSDKKGMLEFECD